MTTLEDSITDDEKADLEQAKKEAKREKTKYGSGVTGSKLDEGGDE